MYRKPEPQQVGLSQLVNREIAGRPYVRVSGIYVPRSQCRHNRGLKFLGRLEENGVFIDTEYVRSPTSTAENPNPHRLVEAEGLWRPHADIGERYFLRVQQFRNIGDTIIVRNVTLQDLWKKTILYNTPIEVEGMVNPDRIDPDDRNLIGTIGSYTRDVEFWWTYKLRDKEMDPNIIRLIEKARSRQRGEKPGPSFMKIRGIYTESPGSHCGSLIKVLSITRAGDSLGTVITGNGFSR
ncbi:hypothetical protein COV20_05210 [Candidatus Woesearchaeota archaeon CG10_big_fil_rev_8_21_14_0_10_45_16]|nr:MAG: hypothetical protein COV20_05210 [Candidatus Woesearchaeota archaeon CG10_big_fil_rev_8_21_14_0_10_45_16]